MGIVDLGLTVDLREDAAAAQIRRVSTAFSTSLDVAAALRKRRTIGLPSGRGTWVRIEARPARQVGGEGWNGVERSAALRDVARPEWYQSMSWRDDDVMWRADETALVTAAPINVDFILTAEPRLSDAWWSTLTGSLSALARHVTGCGAMVGMRPLTQERVSTIVHRAFPDVDATVDEWTTAHGDLSWQNLTAPECVVLDWEDWGAAPRGYDAANLWHTSLAVPSLAARVYRELRPDLDSRSGLVCQLMRCAIATMWPAGRGYEPIAEPSRREVPRILAELA